MTNYVCNVQSWQLFLFCRVYPSLELGTTTGNWNEKENRGNWNVMKVKCYINQAYICGGLSKYDSMAKQVLNSWMMWMLFIRFSIFGRINVSANVVRKFLHTKCVCIWPDTCATYTIYRWKNPHKFYLLFFFLMCSLIKR